MTMSNTQHAFVFGIGEIEDSVPFMAGMEWGVRDELWPRYIWIPLPWAFRESRHRVPLPCSTASAFLRLVCEPADTLSHILVQSEENEIKSSSRGHMKQAR